MISHGILDATFAAAADLSTYQHRFCKVTADRTVNVCGAGELPIGVLQDKQDVVSGASNVRMLGTTEIVAGAAFAAGARLKSAALGKAIAALTTNEFHAIALEAATADGDIVEVFLTSGVMP
jgi:gamma-glutamyl:cysteine ligase YbdK (ATP-grasp superfamily)